MSDRALIFVISNDLVKSAEDKTDQSQIVNQN